MNGISVLLNFCWLNVKSFHRERIDRKTSNQVGNTTVSPDYSEMQIHRNKNSYEPWL